MRYYILIVTLLSLGCSRPPIIIKPSELPRLNGLKIKESITQVMPRRTTSVLNRNFAQRPKDRALHDTLQSGGVIIKTREIYVANVDSPNDEQVMIRGPFDARITLDGGQQTLFRHPVRSRLNKNHTLLTVRSGTHSASTYPLTEIAKVEVLRPKPTGGQFVVAAAVVALLVIGIVMSYR